MAHPLTAPPLSRLYLSTQMLMILALGIALMAHLLGALLAGLLVYLLIDLGARALTRLGIRYRRGRVILLWLIAALLLVAIASAVMFLFSLLGNGQESYVRMLQLMADTLEKALVWLPENLLAYLPDNVTDWQKVASDWLREHAGQFGSAGRNAGTFIIHLLFGVIIGGMVAISNRRPHHERRALAAAMAERLEHLATAFRNVVFSQIRISALNTVLTGAFLAGVLPIWGYPLPFTKTLIAVTFMAGLLPIIGNLISNTVIFLVALSVAPQAAISSLVFLVVIHKLEYFFNAHIIGSRIKAQAWEVLLAMVTMEAVFGLPGLIAAPIFYAYLKEELMAQKLV